MSWLTVLLFLFLFIAGLLGMQFFGFKLDSCVVDGAQQMCPPGLDFSECPSHWNCYVECNATVALTWYPFPGSPYGDQAYCEVFPRGSSIGLPGVEYLAQVCVNASHAELVDALCAACAITGHDTAMIHTCS
eukprot:364557-Chlamydomonas_euryale.AAC.21